MTMLSGRMHWLTVGLALLVSAQGLTTKQLLAQPPTMMPPGGAMQSGIFMPDAPMSMSFPGPAPGEFVSGSPLGPYTEGGGDAQRWFDFYAGTIGLARTSNFGGFQTGLRDPVTGVFARSQVVSTDGISGPVMLRTDQLSLDRVRYGLELIAALQTGPGSNVEARYFGLNNWNTSYTASTVARGTPDLFSIFSNYGNMPPNGFDDTDMSFTHTISYNSELHNGEVNYRRRWISPFRSIQGSWLMGIRYFDLDERFGFSAVGSNNNTFLFDQLRYFDYDTVTRNELTGFQTGGDVWINICPGVLIGVESKAGIFGNHAEVESQVVSNSIPGASEFIQDGRTAYLGELVASIVYRLNYSWSAKVSYNLLYIDNLALAGENMNTRDFGNALGGGNFTANRFPIIDVDGEALYQGFSIGGEYVF
ncbi:MAG: BBP7 family outer membrane beta-barrel protein [Planctomycetales bacterium]|nr:BBP7 family outer membrane beta-barrel protein [Planctomycetales bacterium]